MTTKGLEVNYARDRLDVCIKWPTLPYDSPHDVSSLLLISKVVTGNATGPVQGTLEP